MLTFARVSLLTGKINTMDVNCTPKEFIAWLYQGVKIQNAMPNATADQREFVMTGYTPEDWENLFGKER